MGYLNKYCKSFCSLMLVMPVLLCSCVAVTNQPSKSVYRDVPVRWLHAGQENSRSLVADFGTNYRDPLLSVLLETVLAENNDIRSSVLKIKSARITAGLAFTDRLPVPSASALMSNSYDVKDGSHSSNYSVSGLLSYEIDFWHRYSGAEQIATLEAGATEEDLGSAQLSLIGTAAELYWKIAYLNDLKTIQQASCAAAARTLNIIESRWRAGTEARSDVITAQQNLLSYQEDLQQSKQDLAENWHALALLLNRVPQENFVKVGSFDTAVVPQVAMGLPADLLRNRPDLKGAEIRLQKLDRQVAVTRASYYPRLSLTGSLGSSSDQLREVLQNPLATIGANLTFPFLEWQKMQLDVEQAKITYAAALVDFRDRLINALREVEDALAGGTHYLGLSTMHEQNLKLANQAEQIARVRYQAGAIGLQELLSAQESLRTARKNLNATKLKQLNNSMTLCLALGGGDLKGAGYADRYAQN